MQSEEVLVWDIFWECKHSALIVVHALIGSDLDPAFDDIDFVALELFDYTDDLC